MLCQQVTLSGYAEWPKVADAVIEAVDFTAIYSEVFGQRSGVKRPLNATHGRRGQQKYRVFIGESMFC